MTRKIIKPLKIALFGFIVSLILCFCVGATDFIYTDGVYDESEITNSYQYTQSCEFTWNGFDTSFTTIYLDFTNSSGYSYKIYIIDNIELFHERVDYYVQDKTQDDIFNFLYEYANDHPNNINGYFGSEWYYGTPLLTLYYDYENLYNNIYDEGLDYGYNDGYSDGFSDGYSDGVSDGYSNGFTEGTYNGMQESEALKGGLLTILSAPFYVLGGILDFDILGINLLDIFTGLLTLCLFAFVVKKLINGGV